MGMVLSPNRRRELLQKKQELEGFLKGEMRDSSGRRLKGGYIPRGTDLSGIRNELRRIEKRLEAGEPPKLSEAQLSKLNKERKELEKKIADTRRKYDMSRDALHFKENGERLLRCQTEVNPLILRLRQINYTLDRDNPSLGNTEYLRHGGAEGKTTRPIPGLHKRS